MEVVGDAGDGEAKITAKELKNTEPPKGQEWCAYTALMSKEPTNGVYGVIKILCTGANEKAVRDTVLEMFNTGRLEVDLPIVKYQPTGHYKYITYGHDPKANKEVYNTTTKRVAGEAEAQLNEKRKQAAKEMREAERRLREETEQAKEEDPYSYEVYCSYRGSLVTASSRLKQLQEEVDLIKGIKSKAITALKEISTRHGNYKHRYNEQFKASINDDLSEVNSGDDKDKSEA